MACLYAWMGNAMVVAGDLFVIHQVWLYMNIRMLLIPNIQCLLDVYICGQVSMQIPSEDLQIRFHVKFLLRFSVGIN